MRKIQTRRRYRIIRLRRLRNRLEELLNGFTPSGLYELYETATDKLLRKKIEQRILEMATGVDDLLEIAVSEEEPLRGKAWKRIVSIIKKGRIKKARSSQILKRAMFVPELRKEACELLEKSDPPSKELREILDFEFMRFMPSLTQKIEKLLRKKHKRRNHTAKTIEKVQETVKKINKLKKGLS